ncbi:hypothetical protein GCM10023187_04280 [Nibrella viscosa]|uniref:Toxin-antitoxin system antitoxin component, TIGR02293 family n=2 Tax=Nibrella viscosa TaxID=1084524 RepID=A0ABP8JUC5_9BACT
MSRMLGISESTFQRRIQANGRLTPKESEKVIALAEVYVRGMAVYESEEDFRFWLLASIPALGGRKPIMLLDSTIGRSFVLDILGRIQHGIFS